MQSLLKRLLKCHIKVSLKRLERKEGRKEVKRVKEGKRGKLTTYFVSSLKKKTITKTIARLFLGIINTDNIVALDACLHASLLVAEDQESVYMFSEYIGQETSYRIIDNY